MGKRLIIASGNRGKIREIKDIYKDLNIEIFGMNELLEKEVDIIEDGESLEDNAKIKALFLKNIFPEDIILADDTGLFVDALPLELGVRTARFAGDNCSEKDNRDKLLKELLGKDNRSATFRTVIAIYSNGKIYLSKGEVLGRIAEEEIGENGFGYDKLFIANESGKTFASMDLSEKDQISHRKRALENAKKILKELIWE